MKRNLFFFFLALIFLASSCVPDDDIILKIPSTKPLVNISSSYVCNGDEFEVYAVSFDKAYTSEGVQIAKVEYFWDGKKISTATNASFEMKYLIQNQSIGEHQLKIIIHYVSDEYSDGTLTIPLTIHVRELPPVLRVNTECSREIKNGEEFVCKALLSPDTTFDVKLSKVVFYWDGEKIDEITSEPFVLRHVFKAQKTGIHKLTVHYYIEGEISTDASYSYDIMVVE